MTTVNTCRRSSTALPLKIACRTSWSLAMTSLMTAQLKSAIDLLNYAA